MSLIGLEITLPLSGMLIGITFGLLCGISKEEKIKYTAISVFGTILVAFMGISFYAYGYSLEVLLGFLIWSFIGFIPTFIIGLGYRRRRDTSGAFVISRPSRWEIEEIKQNPPKINVELVTFRHILFGYTIEIFLKMKNTLDITLEDISVYLKISDLYLKKKIKERDHVLPNLVPAEEREYKIRKRIGRYQGFAVDLRILREGVLIGEFHWTKKPNFSND